MTEKGGGVHIGQHADVGRIRPSRRRQRQRGEQCAPHFTATLVTRTFQPASVTAAALAAPAG